LEGPSSGVTVYAAAAAAQAPEQGDLFGRLDEAATYHDAGRPGYFALLIAERGGRKRQESYRLTDMPAVLAAVDHRRDTWLSQGEFWLPNRRTVNLARIGLLFADLDTYRSPAMAGRTPEQQTDALLYHCEAEGLPLPSIVVFSGRGLQAKWLLDAPLPARALPRWNACQDRLIERLAAFGADRAARDASRVLRLVDTTHTGTMQRVRVTHVQRAPGTTEPVRYAFDYLAEVLLPIARWQIQQARKTREARRQPQLELLEGGKIAGGLRKLSGRQLAWDRLADLRTLAALRGGVQEGQRMMQLHWQLNFLALAGAVTPANLWHEAVELARQLDARWHWHKAELGTLYRKAQAYAAGEPVVFNGREYPALYTPRNDTLIRIFGITDAEQKHLKTIIDDDEARGRDAARKQQQRRAAGRKTQAEHLAARKAAAAERRQQAQALAAQGIPQVEIARRLGVTDRAVRAWLRDDRK
jgi:hypothetical protein